MTATPPPSALPSTEPRISPTTGEVLDDVCARLADAIGADTPVDADATLRVLGGTSLHAAVVLASIWRDWHVRLALTDLSQDSTARTLTALIEQHRAPVVTDRQSLAASRPSPRSVKRSALPGPVADTALADLTGRYRRWCRTVSFDNALRWLSRRSDSLPESITDCMPGGALPGATSDSFWLAHRRHGVGGMCVPTAFALCEHLRAAGYDAQVFLAAIDGAPEPDHVTTVVTLAQHRYVLDTVAMTERPIPLTDGRVQVGEGLLRATSRPAPHDGTSTWELGWRTPAQGAEQTCMLFADQPQDAETPLYRATQDSEVFRQFNRSLYARINTATGASVVLGPLSVSMTSDGTQRPGASSAKTLRTVFGWSASIVDALEREGALG